MTQHTIPPADFWEPAVQRAQIWRTVLGFILILVLVAVISLAMFFGASYSLGISAGELLATTGREGVMLMFATFLSFHMALAAVLPLLHRRKYRTLFGPLARLNLKQFKYGMVAVLALAVLTTIFMGLEQLILPAEWLPTFKVNPVSEWAVWALPILALIFIQASAEEVIFRGYLLQQLRARFRSPWIWMVLPSLTFGALHYDAASFGLNAWFYVLNTTLTGMILCVITLKTGNLAAAIGLHFMNNAMMVLLGLNGSFEPASLVVMQIDLKSGYMAYSLLLATLFMVLAFGLWWKWMKRAENT